MKHCQIIYLLIYSLFGIGVPTAMAASVGNELLTIDAGIACAGTGASFTGIYSGADEVNQWSWNFGDNTTGVGQTVIHEFDAAGTYTVILTLITINDTLEQSLSIAVNPVPVVNYVQVGFCSNASVQLQSLSFSDNGPLTSIDWVVDGIFYEGGSIALSDAFAGTHSVILHVTDNLGCGAELTDLFGVQSPPDASFVVENGCEGAPVFLVAANPDLESYAWILGDGTTGSGAALSHTYALADEYQVQLKTTSVAGCVDSSLQVLQIHALPYADFHIGNACLGQPFVITNTSETLDNNETITAYHWTIGDVILTTEDAKVTFTSTGLQTVELAVTTSHGCTGTTQQQIPVWPNPEAAFTYAPWMDEAPFTPQFTNTSIGANAAHWLFGDTGESDDLNPEHTFTLNGTFYTQLVAINQAGCKDTTGQIITVAAPELDVLVYNVTCEALNNMLIVTAQVRNAGNYPVEEMIMTYQAGSTTPMMETWSGTLLRSDSLSFTFQQPLNVPEDAYQYICVTAETSPIGVEEINLTDNQYCKPVREAGLEIFPPYPNPGDDRMFIRFITPIDGDVQLDAYDISGKNVLSISDESVPKGYHQYFIDISNLSPGPYKLQVQLENRKSIVSFVKGTRH